MSTGDDFLEMVRRAREDHGGDLDPDPTLNAATAHAFMDAQLPEVVGPVISVQIPPGARENLPGGVMTDAEVAAELYADLVGVAEIAERLSVPKAQVTNWAHRASSNGFPAPVHEVAATRLWRWSEIEPWWRGYVPQRQAPGKTKPGRLP